MSHQEIVKDLVAKQNITKDTDWLMLAREITNIPRSHKLPVTNKNTLAGHLFNVVILFEFLLAHRDYWSEFPRELTQEEVWEIKDYLLHHDLEEALIGDIPYHVNKLIGTLPNEVREYMEIQLKAKPSQIRPELHNIAKQIDMLDFMIAMQSDMKFNLDNFDGRYLRTCFENGEEAIQFLLEKSIYKIDYAKLLKAL